MRFDERRHLLELACHRRTPRPSGYLSSTPRSTTDQAPKKPQRCRVSRPDRWSSRRQVDRRATHQGSLGVADGLRRSRGRADLTEATRRARVTAAASIASRDRHLRRRPRRVRAWRPAIPRDRSLPTRDRRAATHLAEYREEPRPRASAAGWTHLERLRSNAQKRSACSSSPNHPVIVGAHDPTATSISHAERRVSTWSCSGCSRSCSTAPDRPRVDPLRDPVSQALGLPPLPHVRRQRPLPALRAADRQCIVALT
jgi:hypothetical protein